MKNESNFSSRIGVRGVVAGTISSAAFMLLLMSLIASIGLWDFHIRDIANLHVFFWIATCIAWSISVFFGGFIAASGSKSQTTSEGIFNAIASYAGTLLLFIVTVLLITPVTFMVLIGGAGQAFFFKSFIVGAIGLIFAIFGGIAGARFERRSEMYPKQRAY